MGSQFSMKKLFTFSHVNVVTTKNKIQWKIAAMEVDLAFPKAQSPAWTFHVFDLTKWLCAYSYSNNRHKNFPKNSSQNGTCEKLLPIKINCGIRNSEYNWLFFRVSGCIFSHAFNTLTHTHSDRPLVEQKLLYKIFR